MDWYFVTQSDPRKDTEIMETRSVVKNKGALSVERRPLKRRKTSLKAKKKEARKQAAIEKIARATLKAMRKKHYPRISDFVKRTKIHWANVSKIEQSGSRSMPEFFNLYRWVTACGYTLSEFFFEVERRQAGRRKGAAPPPEHSLIKAAKVLAERDPEYADLVEMLVVRLSLSIGIESARNKGRSSALRDAEPLGSRNR